MTRINGKRLIGAGLLAGLVINLLHVAGEAIMAAELTRTLDRLGLAQPGEAAMVGLAAAGFALGLIAVWLYVALRTRYGAGPGTALRAGLAVWVLACALPNIAMASYGMLSANLFWIATAVDFVTITAATLAGAWVYRDAADAYAAALPTAAARV
jgi:hypothetical protein